MIRMIRILLMAVAAMLLVRFLFKILRSRPYDDNPVKGAPKKKTSSDTNDVVQDADFKEIK